MQARSKKGKCQLSIRTRELEVEFYLYISHGREMGNKSL